MSSISKLFSPPHVFKINSMDSERTEMDQESYSGTDAGISDTFEVDQSWGDFDTQIDQNQVHFSRLQNKVQKYSTLKSTLRVFISTFIFGSYVLPYFMFTAGLLLGLIIFVILFMISYFQSLILLEMKLYAQQRSQSGTFVSIFLLIGFEQYHVTVFRMMYVLNSLFYLVLCYTILGLATYNLLDLYDVDQTQFYLSRRFYVFIGGLLTVPFLFKNKYPSFLVVFAKIIGWFGIMVVVFFSLTLVTVNGEYDYIYPPKNFSTTALFSALPAVILAFAYHQQFFIGMNEEAVTKTRMGSLFGSILILIIELTIASCGFIAFQSEFSVAHNNLLDVVNIDTSIPTSVKALFFITTMLSALLQIIQYIRQSVQQIKNVIGYIKQPKIKNTLKFNNEGSPKLKRRLLSDSKLQQTQAALNKIQSKNQNSKKRFPLIALCLTTLAVLLSMISAPIILPIIIMGSVTQNSLSLLLPSFLYLKWKQDRQNVSKLKLVCVFINLLISLLLGFICLLSSTLQIGLYFAEKQ